MISKISNFLNELARGQMYWLLLAVLSFTLLSIALVFQYAFDELPCVLCIQVRVWVTALLMVSIFGLATRTNFVLNAFANVSVVLIAIALFERSYQLLGTERGFLFGDCGFSLGLPSWFAIEEWLPWLYRIETSCGYTPEIILGITMAEALIVISTLLVLLSVTITIFRFIKR